MPAEEPHVLNLHGPVGVDDVVLQGDRQTTGLVDPIELECVPPN